MDIELALNESRGWMDATRQDKCLLFNSSFWQRSGRIIFEKKQEKISGDNRCCTFLLIKFYCAPVEEWHVAGIVLTPLSNAKCQSSFFCYPIGHCFLLLFWCLMQQCSHHAWMHTLLLCLTFNPRIVSKCWKLILVGAIPVCS